MTARVGTMSVDGTPISEADLARIEAEEKLHTEQKRSADKVVAACATDVEDARLLLSILGLEDVVVAARSELAGAHADTGAAVKRPRRRRAA